ncbi:GFA family protein [Altererythrobacter sp. MF3-039]|uniref:GFA family protein n=1 Tax=Altererythrobacter sp. MF3-039 TaxID=3252901 RepID=UPI00390C8450
MKLNPPISGQCLCGQISYVCSKEPVWSVNCHCRACQKLSGAPFVSAFTVPAESVEISGGLVSFKRQSDAGHEVTTAHCAKCGTRIHAQSAGAKHLLNLFATTLTDPQSFQPISNVYLSEAASWIEPPEARYNFRGMPKA